MRSATAQENLIKDETLRLFDEIKNVVLALPDRIAEEGPVFLMGIRFSEGELEAEFTPSCHEITRALAEFFPVNVHDGFVAEQLDDGRERCWQHSWLTPFEDDDTIIDPIPVGVVSGPILATRKHGFCHYRRECSFLFIRGEEFEARLADTVRAMKAVLNTAPTQP